MRSRGRARVAAAAAAALALLAGAARADLVRVPAGRTTIGAERGLPDERPAFAAEVSAFLLERSPVTVAEFAAFVGRSRHVTTAEALGSGAVMEFGSGRWRLVEGASWRRPLGPDQPAAPADHPVTQVSWHDARDFCAQRGRRLPTEVEWEHAARQGLGRDGIELRRDGRYRANVWTGVFPGLNTAEDGFLLTSPVGAFGRDRLGLTDMAGNVWEWTADWYRPYAEREQPWPSHRAGEKVQRGGSFLCDASVCRGYRVTARAHSTPDSSLMHVGFRCAADAPPAR